MVALAVEAQQLLVVLRAVAEAVAQPLALLEPDRNSSPNVTPVRRG